MKSIVSFFTGVRRELVFFALVGGSGFVVDAGIFWVLSAVVGLRPVVANVVSVSVAIVWTYVGHKYFTFRDQARDVVRQGAQFVVVALVGIGLQTFVVWFGTEVVVISAVSLTVNALLWKVVAVGVGAVNNYVVNKYWTFRKGV